ncbi:MAG: precorrin-8X methylmutase [Rhodospirillales bacterium]|nr:precorrin-8X methylmutase [Rhodospirillales bacterium]
MIEYLRDAAEIHRRTVAIMERETAGLAVADDLRAVALAVVQAAAMPDAATALAASPGAAARGVAALRDGAPVLVDAAMVAHGIDRAHLPRSNDVVCRLNDPATRPLAERLGTTRSAAAVELWADQLAGAVVVIGNAPTALFHLMDRIEQGWPMPAVVLGFPVGFVGAAESKDALAAQSRIPFIVVRGRRGGSAMAAAAVNALAAPQRWLAP